MYLLQTAHLSKTSQQSVNRYFQLYKTKNIRKLSIFINLKFSFFRRNVMKDLVKVIQEESYTYRDPITSFIEDLYVNFDFKGAQQKLRECETVLFNDFFLVACLDDFIENSRLMIFETFCRIHQCISISMLAEKLNMGTGKINSKSYFNLFDIKIYIHNFSSYLKCYVFSYFRRSREMDR